MANQMLFPFLPEWASSSGNDVYGLWAELQIAGVSQRMRWIIPGEFLMGSPEHEKQRKDNEGPQHKVILTEGFWLADTTCSQALWNVVVGDRYTCCQSSELPVVQVNWDDVQQFLEKLLACLPEGIKAVLPSEAEWEYACRAGTTTPFSFGDEVNHEQVNYNYHCPYESAMNGEPQGKIVAVKALPAKHWGLYQMHGNVDEWCDDGGRDYGVAAENNPIGRRFSPAVRGGGWFGSEQFARSARRSQCSRAYRSCCLGFRFSLRPIGTAGTGGHAVDLPRNEVILPAESVVGSEKKDLYDSIRNKFTRAKRMLGGWF